MKQRNSNLTFFYIWLFIHVLSILLAIYAINSALDSRDEMPLLVIIFFPVELCFLLPSGIMFLVYLSRFTKISGIDYGLAEIFIPIHGAFKFPHLMEQIAIDYNKISKANDSHSPKLNEGIAAALRVLIYLSNLRILCFLIIPAFFVLIPFVYQLNQAYSFWSKNNISEGKSINQ